MPGVVVDRIELRGQAPNVQAQHHLGHVLLIGPIERELTHHALSRR
jgi:hypothetical protein